MFPAKEIKMPVIKITPIDKDYKDKPLKHYLNHEDYSVYSIKEDEEMFALVIKKHSKDHENN